jgi:hypothetical protein
MGPNMNLLFLFICIQICSCYSDQTVQHYNINLYNALVDYVCGNVEKQEVNSFDNWVT